MSKVTVRIVFLLTFALASSPTVWAQATARLDGTVVDSTNAVVPNATVVLTNVENGFSYTQTTNGSGYYLFPYVPPASYTMRVSHAAFKLAVVSDIVFHADDRKSLNVTLQLASVSENVEVNATAEGVVVTDSGQKSETITSKEIQNTSTVGPSALELLTLLPGVVQNVTFTFNPNVLSSDIGIAGFTVNGQREDMNTYTLDNGSMVDLSGNNGANLYPNVDAISELTVKTSNYTADQSGSPTVITALTKSGTKDFHGEVYWIGRNYALNANDWSSNQAGLPRPQSKFNYPGFNLGGPVLIPGTSFNSSRKQMFFFFNAQWSRQTTDPGTQLAVVPSQKMLQGDFSDIVFSPTCTLARAAGMAGTTRYLHQPCAILDPATGRDLSQQNGTLSGVTANGAGLLKSMLGPSGGPNYTDPTGQWNFSGRPIRPQNLTQYIGRFDYHPTDKASLFVRLGRQEETQIKDFGEYAGEASGWTSTVPDPTPTIQQYHAKSLTINMVNLLNPTLTNEFTFNFNILQQPNHYQDANKLSKSAVGVNFAGFSFTGGGPNGYPIVPQLNDGGAYCVAALCFGGSPGQFRGGASNLVGEGNFYKQTVFEFKDNVTKAVRTHAFKFGFSVTRARNDQNDCCVPVEGVLSTGTFSGGVTTGDEYGDILIERFNSYRQTNQGARGNFRFSNFEWFAQDNWKANRKLTLEYGARWSWLPPWNEARGLMVTFDPHAYNPNNYNPTNSTDPKSIYNGIRSATCQGAMQIVPLCNTVPKGIMPLGHPATLARVGFAWDAFGTGKAVLRGGVGQYTARDQENAAFSAMTAPPNEFTPSLSSTTNSLTLATIQNTPPAKQSSFGVLGVYNPHENHLPAIYQYNLTLSSALPGRVTMEAGYVGAQSRHLLVETDRNAIPLGTIPVVGANPVTDSYRPFLPFGTIGLQTRSGNSNYNALQITARRQAGRHFDFLASYTYSRAMGNASTYYQNLRDPFDSRHDYRPLELDRTHLLSLSYQYYVPSVARAVFPASEVARGFFDGWMLSGITRASSGGPYRITALVNCVMDTGQSCAAAGVPWSGGVTWFGTTAYAIQPLFAGDPVNHDHNGLKNSWINPTALTLPAFGQQGNWTQPYLKTPGLQDWDLALQKSFKIGESRHLDFRFSSFNFLNRGTLTAPSSFAIFNYVVPSSTKDIKQGQGVLTNGSSLGVIGSKTGHREMEASVKFFF